MKRWAGAIKVAGGLIGIGWYLGICIFLGIWLGMQLDQTFNTRLLFTLIGLFMGLAVAFYGTYRMLRRVIQIAQDKNTGEDR